MRELRPRFDDQWRDDFAFGSTIHGFAGGAFGRDSYACRRVIVMGDDFMVTRNIHGVVELITAERLTSLTDEQAKDRSWCDEECDA